MTDADQPYFYYVNKKATKKRENEQVMRTKSWTKNLILTEHQAGLSFLMRDETR
ncbi:MULTISPECIES: hypothetical protein [unclassified Enterococcus]|uniref:hypothetical protein n=1 Tax=unclassified Enterococcus TaxID=2608891 RepID=UPI0013EB3D71|nr:MULTISPECIES: hypothetical protein [unclassified Enterococcus]